MLIEMAVLSMLPRSAHRSLALQTRKATTLAPTWPGRRLLESLPVSSSVQTQSATITHPKHWTAWVGR